MSEAIDLLRRWVEGHMLNGYSGFDGNHDICEGCGVEAYEFAEIEHDTDCLWIKSKEFIEHV